MITRTSTWIWDTRRRRKRHLKLPLFERSLGVASSLPAERRRTEIPLVSVGMHLLILLSCVV